MLKMSRPNKLECFSRLVAFSQFKLKYLTVPSFNLLKGLRANLNGQSLNSLPGTNTLAYLSGMSVTFKAACWPTEVAILLG